MFGGYTEVAAYYVNTPWPESGEDNLEGDANQLPADYTPQHMVPDPWHRNAACQSDFIMIAEFSEQEGPKPLIVLPKDGGGDFDLNEFSVRIMSVDFQTVSGSSFSMSEDTQVIMTETSNGLYAYVHHFTLYDYQARGFVRPFCMSYVTPDQDKLFSQFEDMSVQFKKVARCFKSGNLDLFVKDLTHYLSDLHYTKERFLEHENALLSLAEKDGNERLCMLGDPQAEALLRTVTISGLDNLIKEVKSILEATSMMLTELEDTSASLDPDNLVSHPESMDNLSASSPVTMNAIDVENFRYSCSLHSHSPAKSSYWYEHRERASSASQVVCNWTDDKDVYMPKLVRTTKKRFEKALRTLHELCMWGAKDGINKLRSLHKYFSRDLYTLQLEQTDAESMEPTCGLLTLGKTVILNFLDGLQIARNLTEADCDSIDTHLDRKWFSSDTVGSFHSATSYLSCVEDISPTRGPQCTPQDIMGNIEGIISSTKYGTNNHGAVSPNTSIAHTPSADMEKCSSCSNMSITESFEGAQDSLNFLKDETSQISLAMADVTSQPMRVAVVSSVDHVTNFNQSSVGYGIQKLMTQYNGTYHVLYSLLTGRPVIVFGTCRMEKDIRATVNALAMFVPGHANLSCIEPYHTSVLCLKDLAQFKLVGLCRPERRKLEHMVPSSVKQYVTIFDIEKKIIWAPSYKGGILTDLYNKRKVFIHEQTYITYIHSLLYYLAINSFIHFHKFCLGCEEATLSNTSSSNESHWVSPQDKIAHDKKSFSILESLHINNQDAHIVQYFSEVVKSQHTNWTEPNILDSNCITAKLEHADCSWIKT